MILAAGLGTRMRPLTETLPKPLLPLMLQPMLGHLLSQLRTHGVREVAINLHHHADQLRQWLGDGSRWDVHLHISYEATVLGSAGGIKQIEPFLSDAPFLVMNADVLTTLDFRAVWEWHCQHEAQVTMVLRPDAMAQQYGPVRVDRQGRVLQINGRPVSPSAPAGQETIFTGIQIISPQVLERIPQGVFSSTTADVYPDLVKQNAVRGYAYSGYWMDIGIPSRYLQAHWDLLDGRLGDAWMSRLPSGAQAFLANSPTSRHPLPAEIIPPVILDRGAQIAPGARVGPYAILGADCYVGAKAEIQNSIALERVHIAPYATINHSILGKGAYIPARSRLQHTVSVS